MRDRIKKLTLILSFIASLEWLRKLDVPGECFDNSGTLLDRYYLYHREKAEGKRLARLYLHKLYRSDVADVWHDHPWHFFSLIIWRGYVEVTPQGRKRIWPGQLIFRPAKWKHRLELNGMAVTLVFAFGRSRAWGFFVGNDQNRILWQDYDYAGGRCD